MRFYRMSAICVCGSLILSGCADSPSSVQAQYVSDVQFKSHTCDDIEEELGRVSSRVAQLSQQQSDAAAADAVSMTVGLVVFWPALFVLAATTDHSAELGRLKGEYEALDRAAGKKRCVISVPALPVASDPKVDDAVLRQ